MKTWVRLVLVVAVAAALAQPVGPRGAPGEPLLQAGASERVGAQRPNPLGVHFSSLYELRPPRRAIVLDRLARAGASWIRIDIGWASLESTADDQYAEWYVELVDSALRAADRKGLKVLAMFWLTPGWANRRAGLRALPARTADYAEALGWAAERWGPTIDAWEIWNEPNSRDFLVDGTPARYARLLCAAYPAVKAHDSSPVLSGGLQYNDDRWLRRLYANGAGDCFDAVATHPYVAPSDAPPETPHEGRVWRLTHTPAIRAVMRRYGDRAKRIWMTEIGWSTGVSDDPDPWDQGVSPRRQAVYLRRAVALVRDRYPYVGPVIWYRDVDGREGDVHENGLGLFRRNLDPKPAVRAFRRAAAGRF